MGILYHGFEVDREILCVHVILLMKIIPIKCGGELLCDFFVLSLFPLRDQSTLLFSSLSSSPSHSLQLPDLPFSSPPTLPNVFSAFSSEFAPSYLCCITASQTAVTLFFHSLPTLSTCPSNLGFP